MYLWEVTSLCSIVPKAPSLLLLSGDVDARSGSDVRIRCGIWDSGLEEGYHCVVVETLHQELAFVRHYLHGKEVT